MEDILEENDNTEMEAFVQEDNDQEKEIEECDSGNDLIVEEPKVGMMFSSEKDARDYYTNYSRREGFGIKKKTQRLGDDGALRYFTLTCSREGKSKSSAKDPLKPQLSSRINCPAKLRLTLQHDGLFRLITVVLEHNHGLSPTKTRFFRCNKKLDSYVKRKLEINDMAGIRPAKNYTSCVIEAGGYENLTYGEKDVRNHLDKARRLRLGMGDGEAIHNYFIRMQGVDSNFFYIMDLDEKSRLRNLFWADARSRATYEAFGDVITFDTTYLTNKYDKPFAPFVGVNHHGHSVLLGCGLLSNEDTETFVWLFRSWLLCMSESHPKAIITDQCKAMQAAIKIVFPNARHRWCLWHIMKKIPEKFKGYDEYESIKTAMHNVVYDSFTENEFEEGWKEMIKEYCLQGNEWLDELYKDRMRWVPIYLKGTFWAGMSTTQRSESMNAFFDGYVNSKTTLKQFVEQYDNALRNKVEKENQSDYHSFNTMYRCFTNYAIERQFQSAYTNSKFKEFQEELMGKYYCSVSVVKEEGLVFKYEVIEDVLIGNKRRDCIFDVYFNGTQTEVNCTCRLFEFRGIICRHIVTVLIHRKVEEIPPKYILSRWRKDLKRNYIFVKTSYNDFCSKPNTKRYDKMFRRFFDIATVAAEFEEKCKIVMTGLCDLEAKVHSCETICVENQSTQIDLNALPNCADDEDVIVQESAKVLSPVVVRRKGRPLSKRKMSTVDKIVQKLKERKKKQYRTMPKDKTVSLKKRAEKSKRGEDTNSSRIANDFGIQANPSCNFGSHSVNISPALDHFRTVNDICTQESMNLMENQGFFSNGGFMAPQHPLNFMAPQNSLFQLQEYSQNSQIGDQTQLWQDNYGINTAEKQYRSSSSIGGRVNMPDFIINSSQAKTNHPSLWANNEKSSG